MKKRNGYFKIVLVPIITAILTYNIFVAYGTDEYVKFTVTDKERIVNNTSEGSSSKYIIFTNRGSFENTDTVFYWKWNSSDLYSSINKDKTYIAHVYGFRVGFLSLYQNIISVEPI
jgi:hypothetical protein